MRPAAPLTFDGRQLVAGLTYLVAYVALDRVSILQSDAQLGITPWKDGKTDEIKRVDYEPVGMVSAAPGGARWYHQHFGASKEPFRLTAWFGPHNPGREPGPPGEKHTDYTAMDIPEGGTAIPYYMEDPFLRAEYAERMKREGAENRMRAEYYERDYRGLLPKE